MKLQKRWIALAIAAAFGAVSYSWTYTPYGRMDWAAALSTRALTFDMKLRPDPNSDLEFKMPINLFLAIDPFWPKEKVAETRDVAIPGEGGDIPARIYRPKNVEGSAPIVVFYHGGGFVLGSVDLFDGTARSLANTLKAVVVSVDYRLAPAHPWPAAVNDCYAALQWAATNAESFGGDASKIAVAGDSAGGSLAAVAALMARDKGGPAVAAQFLFYPATDLTDAPYVSKERFADGYALSREASAAFHKAYVGHVEDRTNPYISPLYAESHAGLAPAFVATAGFDPLTDSAKAYVGKLEGAGVRVTYVNYTDTIHGFLGVHLFKQRRQSLDAAAAFWNEIPAP